MKHHEKPTVYVIDPDQAVRDGVTVWLAGFNIDVQMFEDAESFVVTIGRSARGCVLVENSLPGISGLGLLNHLRMIGNPIPVLLFSSTVDQAFVQHATHQGVQAVIGKPLVCDDLIEHLRAVPLLWQPVTRISSVQ